MPNPQHAILTNLTKYQWYTHMSRTADADLGGIKQALRDLRAAIVRVRMVCSMDWHRQGNVKAGWWDVGNLRPDRGSR